MPDPIVLLYVYSRRGCHLCEEMLEELLPLIAGRAQVEVRDIDTRDDWREAYHTRVPVLEHDGEAVCQYHLDREALARILNSSAS